MIVLMYKPRFAPLVETGTKANTIRPERKRPIKVGDLLSHRTWTGRAYGSPQRILRPLTPCTGLEPVEIGITWVKLQGRRLASSELYAFAKADGFRDWPDMSAWFQAEHPSHEPFAGVLIRWQP